MAGVGAALPSPGTCGQKPISRRGANPESLDGGRTFRKCSPPRTPNDGSETVTVRARPRPAAGSGRGRRQRLYNASRGALNVNAGSPVLVNGPAAVDLGATAVGSAARRWRSRSPATGPRRRSPARHRRRRGRRRRHRRVRRLQRHTLRLQRLHRHRSPGTGPSGRALRDAQPGQRRIQPRRRPSHSAAAVRPRPSSSPATQATRRRPRSRPPSIPARRAAGLLGTRQPIRGRCGRQPAPVHEDQSTKLGKPKATMCSRPRCAPAARARARRPRS